MPGAIKLIYCSSPIAPIKAPIPSPKARRSRTGSIKEMGISKCQRRKNTSRLRCQTRKNRQEKIFIHTAPPGRAPRAPPAVPGGSAPNPPHPPADITGDKRRGAIDDDYFALVHDG